MGSQPHPIRALRWSPYLAGAGIGILSCFTFLTVDRPIGVSTAIARTTGMLENAILPQHVRENSYFVKVPPLIDWEWTLVLGIALGAFLGSRLSGDRPPSTLPAFWTRRFGSSMLTRYSFAFLGGVLLMFGARLAGGCTSGHGISGSLQLALSGWTFFATIFASGAATAAILFPKDSIHG